MAKPGNEELLTFIHSELVPTVVGRATIAWNNVSQSVFSLYHLLSEFDMETAKSTFFIVTSDRSQRDMVSALINSKLKPRSKKLATRAQSLIGEINKLAGKRNDILHVIFVGVLSPNSVEQFHERGHLKGKRGQELLDSIHKLAIDCLDVAISLLEVVEEIEKLPGNKQQLLAAALLKYSPEPKEGELANHEEFGLLNYLPTNPQKRKPDRDL